MGFRGFVAQKMDFNVKFNKSNNVHNYRERIYPEYTSLYTPGSLKLDIKVLSANARQVLARMDRWLPKNRTAVCLDVACGSGGVLYALQTAGFNNLHGVDCSQQQVIIAKQICSGVQQDDAIRYLRENQEMFDLITAFDIIEHFDKHEVIEFLDSLHAALKPGGRMILQTPNADSPWFASIRYGDFTHEVAFTPESLARLLTVCGFESFEAFECRPFAHGLKSYARVFFWHLLRLTMLFWNLVEMGNTGSRIYTRVFIAKVDKPQ
jgi:2-polyprenyl-3-methyl-5-hydroxy-6-metoxy-1,4-benzoquinol methylase